MNPPKSWLPWLRFQRAVGAWAARSLGFDPAGAPVVWADHNMQRPGLPYLGLQVTSGPSKRAQDAELWPRAHPLTVTLTVLPSAVAATGDALRAFVNGELFERIALAGDTVTIARNALLARVQASVQLGATAAPQGVDKIVLTAAEPASLVVEAAIGCSALVATTQLVAVTVGSREVRVRATAYGAPEPVLGSDVSVAEWIELLAEGAQDPELRLDLRRQGLTIARTEVLQRRLSTQSGADREPRSAADIIFSMELRRGRVVDAWLGSVDVAVPTVT